MDDKKSSEMGRMLSSCLSSGMNTTPLSGKVLGMAMPSVNMVNSAHEEEALYGSGWAPIASLSRIESLRSSSVMVSLCDDISNSSYTSLLGNLGTNSSTFPLGQYTINPNLGETALELPDFRSGRNISEMVNSFDPTGCGFISSATCPRNFDSDARINDARALGDCPVLEEPAVVGEGESSPNVKRRASDPPLNTDNKIATGNALSKTTSISKELCEKKQKMEHTNIKQTTKDNSQGGDPKADSIHVRAKRGQATNSHSLAERVRREKISERMRLLQQLVPGCNKITGKAVMLDEIINYVQSLQQQVEFLSMKLATVHPGLNIDIEKILSKHAQVLSSPGHGAPIPSLNLGMSSSHPYSPGLALSGIPNTTPNFHAVAQGLWDNQVEQNLLHMGFYTNSPPMDMAPDVFCLPLQRAGSSKIMPKWNCRVAET
ncbi:hypothetical protein Dimus_027954 [Dionaea muscipula]